jgi:hypothetical protein
MDRLGVNAIRLFANQPSTLKQTAKDFGKNINGQQVSELNGFNNAVNQLRTSNRQNAYSSAGQTNPIDWPGILAKFDSVNSFTGSTSNTLKTLRNMGMSLLLVQEIGCGTGPGTSFQFSTFNNSTSMYWEERWELYKLSYGLAAWARDNSVNFIEFYNEPDLDLGDCLTAEAYKDFYLIRSKSIQEAYADINSRSSSGAVQVNVAASAFAKATYNGSLSDYLGEYTVRQNNVSEKINSIIFE